MYNSVSATTEISCIDHIYTNARHKCSSGSVTVPGASDHNIVCFTRGVIHRRSYKHFVEKNFLIDMQKIDWTEVYLVRDINDGS